MHIYKGTTFRLVTGALSYGVGWKNVTVSDGKKSLGLPIWSKYCNYLFIHANMISYKGSDSLL